MVYDRHTSSAASGFKRRVSKFVLSWIKIWAQKRRSRKAKTIKITYLAYSGESANLLAFWYLKRKLHQSETEIEIRNTLNVYANTIEESEAYCLVWGVEQMKCRSLVSLSRLLLSFLTIFPNSHTRVQRHICYGTHSHTLSSPHKHVNTHVYTHAYMFWFSLSHSLS